MVFLVQNTSLYRVHDFDPLADPWSVFYTNQSPSSIHCLWSISGYGGQSQCCWSKEIHCRHQLSVLCTCRPWEKPSWKFWNDIRIHSQSYIKMYNLSVYYVPLILLNFSQSCYQAKIQIKFYRFYIVDLFFMQLDCMSWPKQMADAWNNDH